MLTKFRAALVALLALACLAAASPAYADPGMEDTGGTSEPSLPTVQETEDAIRVWADADAAAHNAIRSENDPIARSLGSIDLWSPAREKNEYAYSYVTQAYMSADATRALRQVIGLRSRRLVNEDGSYQWRHDVEARKPMEDMGPLFQRAVLDPGLARELAQPYVTELCGSTTDCTGAEIVGCDVTGADTARCTGKLGRYSTIAGAPSYEKTVVFDLRRTDDNLTTFESHFEYDWVLVTGSGSGSDGTLC